MVGALVLWALCNVAVAPYGFRSPGYGGYPSLAAASYFACFSRYRTWVSAVAFIWLWSTRSLHALRSYETLGREVFIAACYLSAGHATHRGTLALSVGWALVVAVREYDDLGRLPRRAAYAVTTGIQCAAVAYVVWPMPRAVFWSAALSALAALSAPWAPDRAPWAPWVSDAALTHALIGFWLTSAT